ncbi:autotransporter domain-containing protein [Synechococcus sp. MIT S9452]|uniref:autotransporter domain-containing protein n=1 Tax=Synechococcus sp. MIT S9452 TaxID=3082546 RepID=UPI0039A6D718
MAAAVFGVALKPTAVQAQAEVNLTAGSTANPANNLTNVNGVAGATNLTAVGAQRTINLNGQILTLGVGAGAFTTAGVTAITGSGTITTNNANNTTNSPFQGNGTITINGDDNLTLTGINTFTGTLAMTGSGTLTINGNDTGVGTYTAANTSTLVLNGDINDNSDVELSNTATLNVTGANTIGQLTTVAGTNVTLGANLTIGNDDSDSTIAGFIGSNNDFIKTGSGTATLSADNTAGAAAMTGEFTVNEGILRITDEDALGGAGNTGVTINNGGTLDIQLTGQTVAAAAGDTALNNGGTLSASTGSATYADNIDLTGLPTIDVDGTQLTLSGVIDGAGGGFTKTGLGELVLSADNTYTGLTNVSAGTLTFGANGTLEDNNLVSIANGGTLNLGGFTTNNLRVTTSTGSTLRNGVLVGSVNAQGGTITNVSGGAALNINSGATTLSGTNSFGNIALNGGTATLAVPASGTPLTSTGTVSAGGGILALDASSLTQAQVEGDKTIVAGNVDDAVAASTTFTFDGRTERFSGFNKTLDGVGLYDIQLKKGSIILSIQRKGADDICGVTGLCTNGQTQGKLEGLDRTEVRSLYGKVVLPALNSGRLNLPFWTTNTQMSKYLISGLLPRNVDAAGTVLSSYNDRMADTLFERLPLRQFEPVEVVEEEIVIEEVETKEPVRGLWKTTGEGEVIEVNGQTYEENPSLTAQYADRENMRAWVRGFGGDVAAAQTTKYLYKDYNATNAGGVVGVDYAVFNDFQVGLYANYGDLAINTDANKYAGSGSWNPTGWGGGITADYWTDSYYVQGLFGASAFSGDQDRSIVAIGGDLGGGNTLSGNKNITSYVGALRAGAPMQLGSFYLEPQAQATWSGNQEEAFNEGGNTNFKLKYKSRETNFLQTELGFKLAYPIAMGQTQQLIPSIRVAWLGDWNMNNQGQKIGYRFSNKTVDLESNQKDQNGALLEGGLDYTVANIGATSFKVYGRGGAEVWDTERETNWRASGGITVQF